MNPVVVITKVIQVDSSAKRDKRVYLGVWHYRKLYLIRWRHWFKCSLNAHDEYQKLVGTSAFGRGLGGKTQLYNIIIARDVREYNERYCRHY